MKKYGISVYDSNGHVKSLAAIAQSLQDQLSGVDEATRNAALAQIFGNAQITAATVLYQGGAKAVTDWTNQVNDAGFAQRQAAALTDNLKGDIERLSGSIDTAFIKSGSSANSVLRSMAQNAEGAVNVLSNLPAPVLLGGAAFTAFALVGPKIVQQYKDVRSTLDDAGLSIDKISEKAPRAGAALGKMSAVAKGTAVAVGALAVASRTMDGAMAQVGVQQLTNDLGDGSDALKTINAAFGAATDTGTGFDSNVKSLGDALRYTFNPGTADSIDSTAGSIFAAFGGNNTSDIKVATDRLTELDQALAGLVSNGQATQAANVMGQIENAAKQQGISVDDLQKKFPTYAEALAAANAQATKFGDATAGATGPADQMTGILQDNADAAKEAADALDKARKAFIDYGDTVSGAINANVAYQQSLADANKQILDQNGALDKNKLGLDATTQAGRDNLSALTSLAEKAKENALATYDQTGKTDALTASIKSQRDQFIDVATKMSGSRAEAVKLADQLGLTTNNSDLLNKALASQPKETSTTVKADTAPANAAVDGSRRKLDALDGRVVTAKVQVDTAQAFANVRNLASYIDGIRSKTVTIDTYVGMYAGKPTPQAFGSILDASGARRMADGDVGREAMFSDRPILWGEAGPEAYIPLSPAKRTRSLALWAETGRILGASAAMHFADGGFASRVAAQSQSQFSATQAAGLAVNIGNVNTYDTPAAIARAVETRFNDAMAVNDL